MHRSHRLRKNEEFQVVFQKGKSAANRQFVIYSLPKNGQTAFRVGISVSKKLGQAVVRNRLKRLIREAVNSLEDRILPHYDLVIIARHGVEDMDYQAIVSSLKHALKRAHVIQPQDVHTSGKRDVRS